MVKGCQNDKPAGHGPFWPVRWVGLTHPGLEGYRVRTCAPIVALSARKMLRDLTTEASVSTDEIANLFAKRYIARTDVKAVQHSNGAWTPDRTPWTRPDLNQHLAGTRTFGHYLLNPASQCKVFAFDIDLRKNSDKPGHEFQGYYPPEWNTNMPDEEWGEPMTCDPRVDWQNRAHPARPWLKYQMKMLASMLLRSILTELEIPGLVAYSGSKGLHVYAFPGLISAEDARDAAAIVTDSLACFKPFRGDSILGHVDDDPVSGFPNFTIEVFPKQGSLSGKDLGNLMRLPLGKNLKNPQDPCFFVDMASPMGVIAPMDPIQALSTLDAYANA